MPIEGLLPVVLEEDGGARRTGAGVSRNTHAVEAMDDVLDELLGRATVRGGGRGTAREAGELEPVKSLGSRPT